MLWSLKTRKYIVIKPHFPMGALLNIVNFISNKPKKVKPLSM